MKQKYLLGILTTALLAVSCQDDDLVNHGTTTYNDGKIHFAVGTQDQWTPETRAANSRVDIINLDMQMDGEPLCVVIEDQLMGDTVSASQPTTRGQRYTSEDDDGAENERSWDGSSDAEHRMHDSFALMGMKYTGSSIGSFSSATVWTDLGDEIGTEYETDYCVIMAPSDRSLTDGYETWNWGDNTRENPTTLEEVNWPGEGGVFLFACAPAQVEDYYGIQFSAEDGKAPYIDYTVPDRVAAQQDLMIATRDMTRNMIDQTTAGNPGNPDIELNFQHICTAVKFRLAGDANSTTGENGLKIKSITMKDVVNQARFTYNATEVETTTTALAGEWDPDPEHDNPNKIVKRSDMTYDFGTDGKEWKKTDNTVDEETITPDDNAFMMIPQQFLDNDLEIQIKCLRVRDSKEFILKVIIKKELQHEWRPGHVVIYTIAKVGEVTIGEPQFEVTAVTDALAALTPVSGNYEFPFTGTNDLTFKVVSYQHYTIEGASSGDVAIPWEITEAQMGSYNYRKGNLPDMISMDVRKDTTIIDENTNTEETIKKDKTWGVGGVSDTIHANVNFPSRRGRTTSTAMNKVLKRNAYGTEDSPQDLSMLGLDGAPMQRRNTANCYVVSAPGYYSIPLVYGNAIMGGDDNTKAYIKANGSHSLATNLINGKGAPISAPWISGIPDEPSDDNAFVLWQTSPDLVTNVELEKRSDPATEEQHWFVNFAITPENINLGNSVIAVSDGTDILWSWHIWVNDYDEVNEAITVTAETIDYDFMEVNLGWTDGYTETFEDSICTLTFTQEGTNDTRTINIKRNTGTKEVPGTGGTYYQNGRKDPFPSVSISLTETFVQNTGPTNQGGEGEITLRDADDMMFPAANRAKFLFNQKDGYTVDVNSSGATLKDGIKHPNLLYLPTSGKTNWFTDTEDYYDNLWNYMPLTMVEETYLDENSITHDKNIHTRVWKTIYDPCPVGYCIPNPGAFKAFYQKVEKKVGFNYSGAWSDVSIIMDENEYDPASWPSEYRTDQACYNAVCSDYQSHGYTPVDTMLTLETFAHASTSFKWKNKVTGVTAADHFDRFEGIDGLCYTGASKKLFFPSAGMRNPNEGGETHLDGYRTFNNGGYYATAFAAPDDGTDGANFFWIQRKRLRDALNRILLSSSQAPLFDPYNEDVFPKDLSATEKNKFLIYVYRNGSQSHASAMSAWGANLFGNGGLNLSLIPRVVNKLNGSTIDGVYVHFLQKTAGPVVYTTKEWSRARSYGVSVRPIRDENFSSDVGIAVISNTDATPYRNTRAPRKR